MPAEKIFNSIRKILVYTLVLLFPLFALSLIRLDWPTDALYFLAFFILLIYFNEVFHLAVKNRLVLRVHPLDLNSLFLVLVFGLSVIFRSANKIQALFAQPFGWGLILFLVLFYLAAGGVNWRRLWFWAKLSALLVSVFTLTIFLLSWFKIGSSLVTADYALETALFLGFFVISGLVEVISDLIKNTKTAFINGLLLAVCLLTFLINLNHLLRQRTLTRLSPYSISLRSADAVVKNPRSAILGRGIDNFNVNPNQAPSFFLQILVETGVLGLSVFALLLGSVIFFILQDKKNLWLVFLTGAGYLIAGFALFPMSPVLLFLLFLLMAAIVGQKASAAVKVISLTPSVFLRTIIAVVIFMGGVVGFYFVGRVYLSEYYFANASGDLRRNQVQSGYEGMKRAIGLNPHNEVLRREFSRLNLLIADQLASKEKKGMIQSDKQKLITGAIEAAIAEAKAAVALNPEKPANWANLALIYKNLVGTVNGADVWAAAAYERAMVTDPVNPSLPLELGGVYYATGNFDEAEKLFSQAITLKPDWSNAYYNRAWSLFRQKKYDQAVIDMERVLILTDPKSANFAKATQELEEFKKKK